MNECTKRGCRNLEYRCKDCGRVVNIATFMESSWISVKDRLPEDELELVLVFNPKNAFPRIAGIRVEAGVCPGMSIDFATRHGVTHWQPLPEPPE